nr:MAG TPA: hypothetical protein [Caudoviricetes sp.]
MEITSVKSHHFDCLFLADEATHEGVDSFELLPSF